jgi:hypothetical protein
VLARVAFALACERSTSAREALKSFTVAVI